MAEKTSDPVLESTTAEPPSDGMLSLNEGISAIESLLGDDPLTADPAPGSRPSKTAAPPADQKPSVDDENFWEDEVEGADEATEQAEDDEDEEGEDGEEGGAMALSDDTEIDLGEGQKAKLGDLKADFGKVAERVKDMQRHFTQEMQKVGDERKIVSTQADRVIKHAQEVRAQRELIEAHAKRYMPQAPQRPQAPPQQDPIGWMEYQAQKEQYDEYMGSLYAIRQTEAQAKAREEAEQAAQMPEILDRQRTALLTRYPRLRNPELAAKTMGDLVQTFQSVYGFPQEEILKVKDARLIAAMLDATAFHRLKAKRPAAERVVEGKPKLMKQGRRMDANEQRKWGDKAKMKRLAQTGSLDAAADVLMDLI